MEPNFVVMKLPGETAIEFVEITPFTPTNRNNPIGWMDSWTQRRRKIRLCPKCSTRRRSCAKHDEDEQDPEGRRWHSKKIDGRGLHQMILQKRSPSRGRRFAGPRQIPGHRGLRHRNAQLEQFSVNAGCHRQKDGRSSKRHWPDAETGSQEMNQRAVLLLSPQRFVSTVF
jgi:hypothetical protein